MLPEVRLDTDSFKALIEEYRMQIAGIFPEWTNYNYSDPGMTLVELFAWMKENQQFFMEQLSPEHYKSFLRLMGITPQKRIPAEVVASPENMSDLRGDIIPAGTVLYSDDVPYTVKEDFSISSVSITGIRTDAYVTREELEALDTFNIYPFGKEPKPGDMMEVYLDAPLPVDKEHSFMVRVQDKPARNAIDEAAFCPLIGMDFEYYTNEGWKQIPTVYDGTRGFLFSGKIRISFSEPMAEAESGKYALRMILREGTYDRVPCILYMGFHFIRLIQQIEERCSSGKDVLFAAEGTGFPNQRIQLPFEGIIRDSVEIEVEDVLHPGQMKTWRRVGDFSKEGPSSECFIADESTDELVFGDGLHGLPPEGKIIVKRAVTSKGFAGTAMPGTILTTLGGDRFRVMYVGTVGKDPETLEEMKIRAKTPREKYALSTAADYERTVLKTPGLVIHSCKVLESLSSPTKVTIAVRPGDGKEHIALSHEMEANIYSYLEERRQIGTELRFMSPEYIKVNLNIHIVPSNRYADVEKKVEEAVRKFINDDGGFGEIIMYGRLYGIIDSLDCVEKVIAVSTDTDKVSVIKSKGGDLVPPANGLFSCGNIKITI